MHMHCIQKVKDTLNDQKSIFIIEKFLRILENKLQPIIYFQWRQSRLKTTSAKWDFEALRLEI